MTHALLRIGLDLGTSSTKIAAVDPDGRIRATLKIEPEGGRRVTYDEAIRRFLTAHAIERPRVRCITVTGIGSLGAPDAIMDIPVRSRDEFSCIGRGALFLTGLSEAVIISMGTGTALVRARGLEVTHLGGSGVGGGMLLGLCRHFYKLADFDEIMDIAGRGDLGRVDLQISHLTGGGYGGMGENITVANLARMAPEARREDVVLGIINMILETVGMMGAMACRCGGWGTVAVSGAMTRVRQSGRMFERLQELTGIRFVVAADPVYATAVGAALLGETEAD